VKYNIVMEGLESPRQNGEALMQFDVESDGVPLLDYLNPKIYFYSEEIELHGKVFPQEWFSTMSKILNEELISTELPCFTVRTRLSY